MSILDDFSEVHVIVNQTLQVPDRRIDSSSDASQCEVQVRRCEGPIPHHMALDKDWRKQMIASWEPLVVLKQKSFPFLAFELDHDAHQGPGWGPAIVLDTLDYPKVDVAHIWRGS